MVSMNIDDYYNNKCNAIIVSGKNKGKCCTRINCLIKGHNKYKKGKGKCGNIIKFGRNKGLECGRINCYIHGPNIIYYLDFPKFLYEQYRSFNDIEESRLLINIYQKYKKMTYIDNINKNECYKDIKYLLMYIGDKSLLIKMKYAVYIYHLLDTESMVSFRFKYPNFNKTVSNKLEEFTTDRHVEFSTYIKNNFETKKKYLSKTKNRINLLRNYVRSKNCFLNLYKKVKKTQKISFIFKINILLFLLNVIILLILLNNFKV